MNSPTFSSTDLRHLQRQLKSWRQRQPGRPRLPDSAWEAAAALAAGQGVSRVARTLRIDFHRLKSRVRGAPAGKRQPPPPSGFLELKLAAPSGPISALGMIELVAGPSRRLVIHTGGDPASWVALAEAFWRAHP